LRVVVVPIVVVAGVAFVFLCVGYAKDGGGGADSTRVEGDDVVRCDDGVAEA
jgi:hypothetical protein